MFKLIIFDFDGTLFDSLEAISVSINRTFEALLPSYKPPASEIHRFVSVGAPPEITFQALQPQNSNINADTFDEEGWVKKYRELYEIHGQPLTKPYPGAREVLLSIRARGIPIAIVSNKAAAAVKKALLNHGLGELVPDELIVGEPMFGGRRKPDPAGYTEVLLPRLREICGEDFVKREGEVLMVGDTITDILFARNIGSRVCWCRFGQGNLEKCENAKPDFIIDTLVDMMPVVDLQ